jgi:glycosyltransferase involved in cell wall biosynthesis
MIKRLLLVTDAWHPQINGVVTTLNQLVIHLRQQGVEVEVVHPGDYPRLALPTYREIDWVWRAPGLKQRLLDFQPEAIHIATEGSLGWRVRRIAQSLNWPFTSSYHTKYPEYLAKRLPIPTAWTYALLRRFHRPAQRTFVPAQTILEELQLRGFQRLSALSRGVDHQLFHPNRHINLPYAKPILLYVGRLAVEKNLDAFLGSRTAGTKLVIGDGPARAQLQARYPQAHFLGVKQGIELAQYYASADVMVFPSKTDTFGLVNIEAMACGTPVAAYPVTGPRDIITHGLNGALDDNLDAAIERALQIQRGPIVADSVASYRWSDVAERFIQQLSPIIPS